MKHVNRLILAGALMLMASSIAGAAEAEPKSVGKDESETPINCLRETGSRIAPKKGECLPVAGRTYSRDELGRTGRQSTGDALRQLDPSITTGH